MKMTKRMMMLGAAACLLTGVCACGKAAVEVNDEETYVREAEGETEVETASETETESEAVSEVLTESEITSEQDAHVTVDTLVETETIEYETIYEDDDSMQKGQEQVSVEGEYGEKEVTYTITYVDGIEESREVTDETVTKEPVNEVIKRGTKEESSAGGSERTVVSKKAFYDCDSSGHGYYEITYSDGSVEYEEF